MEKKQLENDAPARKPGGGPVLSGSASYPTVPGWYCLGFDRLDPQEQADIGPHLEGIYHFTGEEWLDEDGETVCGIYDPSLGLEVSMSAADYYVRN